MPAGRIQGFFELMETQRTKVQLFTDAETGIELGMFISNPAINRQISEALAPRNGIPLPSHKRAWSQTASSEGQYGSEPDDAELSQLERSVQPTGDLPLVYSTTSKNRDQKRKKARLARREQAAAAAMARVDARGQLSASRVGSDADASEEEAPRPAREVDVRQANEAAEPQSERAQVSRRLVIPDSDSESDAQPRPALVAHPKGPAVVVHPWFQHCLEHLPQEDQKRLSAKLQKEMKKNAEAIGGSECVQEWKKMIAVWKRTGKLTSRPTSRGDRALVNVLPHLAEFKRVYEDTNTAEVATYVRTMTARCRLVRLAELYETAIEEPIEGEEHKPSGFTARAFRKAKMFVTLYPQYVTCFPQVARPQAVCRADFKGFTYRLDLAHRWAELVQTFGSGIVGLVPETVTNRWLERGLTNAMFAVWIKVIQEFNPKAVSIGHNWGRVLAHARSGGQYLPTQPVLQLESIHPTTLKRYSDTQSLFLEPIRTSRGEAQEISLPDMLLAWGQAQPDQDIDFFAGMEFSGGFFEGLGIWQGFDLGSEASLARSSQSSEEEMRNWGEGLEF